MRVLIAVDGSEHSNRAVDYVALHWLPADPTPCILLCYADPDPAPLAPTCGDDEDDAELARYHTGNADTALRYGHAVFESVGLEPVEHRLVGPPAAGILMLARQSGADVIVLGAHGSAAHSPRPLGTVAERVLAESAVPVLVVP
ncbi:MAG: universal stress protein [Rhodanobacteraceae bacterium]|nr:universal stress protein [Rhodanobacteraceae bacterium]